MSKDEVFYKNYKRMSTMLTGMIDELVINSAITDIDRTGLLTRVIFNDPNKFYQEEEDGKLREYLKELLTETIIDEVEKGNIYSPMLTPTKGVLYEIIK